MVFFYPPLVSMVRIDKLDSLLASLSDICLMYGLLVLIRVYRITASKMTYTMKIPENGICLNYYRYKKDTKRMKINQGTRIVNRELQGRVIL